MEGGVVTWLSVDIAVAGVLRQGHDGSRVRIHHHDVGAFGLVLLHQAHQMPLDQLLDWKLNGQMDVGTIQCCIVYCFGVAVFADRAVEDNVLDA